MDTYEKSILTSLTISTTMVPTDKYPIYYEENGDLIREDQDGTKYKIKLDKNNNEQIIKKI